MANSWAGGGCEAALFPRWAASVPSVIKETCEQLPGCWQHLPAPSSCLWEIVPTLGHPTLGHPQAASVAMQVESSSQPTVKNLDVPSKLVTPEGKVQVKPSL